MCEVTYGVWNFEKVGKGVGKCVQGVVRLSKVFEDVKKVREGLK